MTIAFRAGISSVAGTSANFSVDISGMGLAQNDLVLVLTGYAGGVGAGAGITSTGWHSEFNGKTTPGGTKCWYDASWKIMGSTPDTSVTIKGSTDAGTPVIVLVQAWSGVDTTTPMDVAPVYAGMNAPPDPGAITPVTAGAVVVAAGIAAGGAYLAVAPTGYTNLTANKLILSNFINAAMASKVWSGSGAEDPAAFTVGFPTSTGFAQGAFTFALRPSPTLVIVNEANLAISEVGNAHRVYPLAVLPSNVKNGIVYSSDGVNWNTGTYAGSGGSGVPIGTVLLDIKTGKLFKILSNSSGMTL